MYVVWCAVVPISIVLIKQRKPDGWQLTTQMEGACVRCENRGWLGDDLLHGVAGDAADGHVGTALVAGRDVRLGLCVIGLALGVASCGNIQDIIIINSPLS